MVFSYSKYNLGTDFTLFLYMGILCFAIMTYSILVVFYMFCCGLEKLPSTQVVEIGDASQRGKKKDYDFENDVS